MSALATLVAPLASPVRWAIARVFRSPALAVALVAASGALALLGARHDVSVLPFVILLAAAAVYVADVARAREIVRDVVLLGWRAPPRARCVTARAESLIALAAAFGAVRAKDAIGAEVALGHVRRVELGAWELRVFDAVRALASVEVADDARAAALAPLALPTGDFAVDRALALVAVRTAWDNPRRLSALALGLRRAGPHLADLGALSSLRGGELDGTLDALPADCPPEVAARARDVGDERFADLLASLAARRGVYR